MAGALNMSFRVFLPFACSRRPGGGFSFFDAFEQPELVALGEQKKKLFGLLTIFS